MIKSFTVAQKLPEINAINILSMSDRQSFFRDRIAIVICSKDRGAIGDRKSNDRDREKRDLFSDCCLLLKI